MKYKLILIMIVIGLLSTACSNNTINKDEKVSTLYLDKKIKAPEWFQKYPLDNENKIYAAATGLSEDMQLSVDKAMHDAKIELADKMWHKINADLTRFIQDSGNVNVGNITQETTKISQNVIERVMVNKYKVVNKQILNVSSKFRTFVLLEYDINDFEAPNELVSVDRKAIQNKITSSNIIE